MSYETQFNDASRSNLEALKRLGWLRQARLSEDLSSHSYQQYQLAVRELPEVLPYLRQDLVDDALCRLAIGANARAISAVPAARLTDDLCLMAAEAGARLEDVPEQHHSWDVRMTVLRQRPNQLKHIPYNEQTHDMVDVACRTFPRALGYANPELVDIELCRSVITQTPNALYWAPAAKLTYDLCYEAVGASPPLLHCVPEPLRDQEMCLAAIGSALLVTKEIFASVPPEVVTLEFCYLILKQNPKITMPSLTIAAPTRSALEDMHTLDQYREWLLVLKDTGLRTNGRLWLRDMVLTMISAIPVGKQHLDQWRVPRSEAGRQALDDLLELSSLMRQVVPDHHDVDRFAQRVNRMVEMTMKRNLAGTAPTLTDQSKLQEAVL